MPRSRGHAATEASSSRAPTREGTVTARSVWVSAMSGQAGRLGLQATTSARPVTMRAEAAGTPGFASSSASSEKPRALLDRYCVTCHNDRVKTANLSLQGLDLTKAAEQAEVWEKVIHK